MKRQLCVRHQLCPWVITLSREGSDLNWAYSLVRLNWNGAQVLWKICKPDYKTFGGAKGCLELTNQSYRSGHCASSLRARMYSIPPPPQKYTRHGPGWIPHSEIILYWTHLNLDLFFSLPHTQAIRTSRTRDLERIQVDLSSGDAGRAQGSLQKRVTCPLCVNRGRVSFHLVYIWGFCLRSILNKLFTW